MAAFTPGPHCENAFVFLWDTHNTYSLSQPTDVKPIWMQHCETLV